MKQIALCANGPYSGKTTLARELERHGYLYVGSDLLKDLYAKALTDANPSKPVTVADIQRDKATYRIGLQHFADHIGFNNGEPFVSMALEPWFMAGMPEAVYDCVRTRAQVEALKVQGFKLIHIEIDDLTRRKRARTQGVRWTEVKLAMAHPLERAAVEDYADLIDYTLDGTLPVPTLAQEIIDLPDEPLEFDLDAMVNGVILAGGDPREWFGGVGE